MKADPDFHPIAAAWLDGTATPPEQRLLSEILHTAGNVEEYAALCRTEALLQQTGRTAAERRKSIAAMLSGKPWPQRAVLFLKSRPIRWAAAAAVLAIGAWALWPSAAPEEKQTAGKSRVSPRMTESSVIGGGSSRTMRDAPLPPAAGGLEQRLRRYYVANFKTAAPLPEAAAALAAAITPGSDYALTADVRDPGDAPVHLKLPTSLPAWTLLEMMALQSGTDFQLSGHSLVFRTARKPVLREGSLSRISELTPLRTLFAVKETDDHSDELNRYGSSTQTALGSGLEFLLASESSNKYTGPPRDVRVLELALSASTNPPMMVRLNMKAMELPRDLFQTLLVETGGITGATKDGLFLSDEHMQLLMRAVSLHVGVDLMTMSSMITRPNQRVSVTTNPEGKDRQQDELMGEFVATPTNDSEVTVEFHYTSERFDPQTQGTSTQKAEGRFTHGTGQTSVLAGMVDSAGVERVYLLTTTIVDSAGTPLFEAGKTPPAPAAPPEELPYGIPVADKKGMVQSPYAPEKGFIDVEGLKRGTRVECPYTGKHFRVP